MAAFAALIEFGRAPDLVAQLYNTGGPDDYCPSDKIELLNPTKLAAELGAVSVYLSPTPLSARLHLVMDQLWFFNAGESVDFHGVKATWTASMKLESMIGLTGGPYTPRQLYRDTKYLYAKGSQLFLLHEVRGITWVMQFYSTEVEGKLTFDQLAKLGSTLKLEERGLRFEAKTLTRDLIVDPRNATDNMVHILRDELHNVYVGCGFDNTCSYMP